MSQTKKSIKIFVWILLFLGAGLCAFFAANYFSVAMPAVQIEIRMDRELALEKSHQMAQKLQLERKDTREVAYFSTDTLLQSYIELQPDGKSKYQELLAAKKIAPYQWLVRQFSEGNAAESVFYFTPDGSPYGFSAFLPESDKGAALDKATAKKIAEESAIKLWDIDFKHYVLAEESSEVKISGRVDHVFVYERDDLRIFDAPVRLSLQISGDKFSGLGHSVQIPDAFKRQYQDMRTGNYYVSLAGSIAFYVLYVLGGCLVGLALLYRLRWLKWKPALALSLVVGGLNLAAALSSFPQQFLSYDTAVPIKGFIFQQLLQILLMSFAGWAMAFIALMAAEGLTRFAFPKHLQLWQVFSREVASSPQMWGRVVGGYLVAMVHLAYVVAVYWLAYKYLGWWSPSDTFFDPNILASYFPWVIPVSQAFQAGLLEECLFRAVPLSIAAIIGQRLGKRSLIIAIVFIAQGFIFGAMHANYAVQPSYARMLELLVPSYIFAALYLRFGLVPAALSHVIYDLILMASPIFIDKSSSSIASIILIVVIGVLPVLILLFRRWQFGRFKQVAANFYNSAFVVAEEDEEVASTHQRKVVPIARKTTLLFSLAGLAGFILWLIFSQWQISSAPVHITSQQAIATAEEFLKSKNVELQNYQALFSVNTEAAVSDYYVFQNDGEKSYKNLQGSFLPGPHYRIRFARFEGSLLERAEEYALGIDGQGKVIWYSHTLPQEAALPSLAEDQARAVATAFIKEQGFDLSKLKEITGSKVARPNRSDWNFVYADAKNGAYLGHQNARINIAILGDKIEGFTYSIHTPEEWSRSYTSDKSITSSLESICTAFVLAIILMGAIRSIVLWSRGYFIRRSFWLTFMALFALYVIGPGNSWPAKIYAFNAIESFNSQETIAIILILLKALFVPLCFAFIFGTARFDCSSSVLVPTKFKAIIALSLSLVIAGVMASLNRLFGPAYPSWGSYEALTGFYPALSEICGTLSGFISNVIALLLLALFANMFSNHFERRKLMTAFLFILFGISMVGSRGIVDVSDWLIPGTCYGLLLLLAYARLFSYDFSLAPLLALPSILLVTVDYGFSGVHSGIWLGVSCSMILVTLLASFWFWSWQKDAVVQPDRQS